MKAAKETGKVVTVEEHSVIGGLGGAVAEVLSEKAPTKMLRIGINDVFGESGPAVKLLEKYGIDANRYLCQSKSICIREICRYLYRPLQKITYVLKSG